jgi:hypothetical protein
MSSIPPFPSSSLSSLSAAAPAATSSKLDLLIQATNEAALRTGAQMRSGSLKRKNPPDNDEAAAASKRARLDEAQALFNQATQYIADHNDTQAILLLEQALALGYLRAQKHLAFACVRQKRFADLAKYSLMIVKRRESGSALHNLAMLYHKGAGVVKDEAIAWAYAERAAARRHPFSLVWMARRYESGVNLTNNLGQIVGVIPKDSDKAREFYEIAAKQEHPFAQNRLAQMNAV